MRELLRKKEECKCPYCGHKIYWEERFSAYNSCEHLYEVIAPHPYAANSKYLKNFSFYFVKD